MKLVDYVRGGALAAGGTTFLIVWWQGLGRLGYVEWTAELAWAIWLFSAIGIAIGAVYGHRDPSRPLFARIALTAVVMIAFGAALVGLSALSSKVMRVGERSMPPLFLALAIMLVTFGIRRVPETRGRRIALLSPFLLLLAMRAMAASPPFVHRLEARFLTISAEKARALWDKRCGLACQVGRTVALKHEVEYLTESPFLVAKVKMHAELEATKAFVQDGCNQIHLTAPIVPEWVKPFKTKNACFEAKPAGASSDVLDFGGGSGIGPRAPSYMRCCYAELVERKPGDKFPSYYGEELVFHRLKWKDAEGRAASPLY